MTGFRAFALQVVLKLYPPGQTKLSSIYSKMEHTYPEFQKERHKITEMVNGALRHQLVLEKLFEPLIARPPKNITKWILYLAAFELITFDGSPDYATINEWVEITRNHRKEDVKFVNALLRKIQSEKPDIKNQWISLKEVSLPKWIMADSWFQSLSKAEIASLAIYFTERPHIDVLSFSPEISFPNQIMAPYPLYEINDSKTLLSSSDFSKGMVSVFDRSSFLVALYGYDLHSNILADLCAAPGNKVSFWAKQPQSPQTIISIDKSQEKIDLIQKNLKRLGLDQTISVKMGDSTQIKLSEKADTILLDAPCSGSGVINRKPDIRINQSTASVNDLVILQRQLLENANQILSKNGKIVYSTCSLLASENEEQIKWFLNTHPDYTIEKNLNPIFTPFLTEYGIRIHAGHGSFDGACAFILRKG